MVRWILLGMLALVMFWPGTVATAGQYPDLTAPEVKMMVAEQGALLVHVLSRLEFDIQHIPGSINIPITEVATSDLLPADKKHPVIFYCMGVR
jgi:rhodanese-related sulfurtransferase